MGDMLFDRVIDVTFRNYTTVMELASTNDTVIQDPKTIANQMRDFPIKCPRTGAKPDITLEVTMLPGQICHEMTLSIVNFSAEVDITEFLEVEVRAGYAPLKGSSAQLYTFICPIFSSYVEAPNPNGRTIFKGVVAGSMQKLLTPYPVEVVFHDKDVTLQEMCTKIINGLGLGVEIDWPPAVKNLPMHVERKLYIGKTGYSTINWLANQLFQLSQAEGAPLPKTSPITFNWDGDTIRLGLMGYTGKTSSIQIPDLTQVTMAAVQGGVMNIKAPWDPRVRPGSIIKMESRYFRGRMAPNAALPQLLSPSSLYNVIKVELSFGTMNLNEMSLLTTPVKSNSVQVDNTPATVEQKAEKAKLETTRTTITFGDPKVDENDGSAYSVNLGSPLSMPHYVVKAGDTLAGLATQWYGSIKYVKFEDSEGARLTDVPPGGTMPLSGYGGAYFWPVIFFATAEAMKTDDQYYVDKTNPNALQIGKRICKPAISDPDSIQGGPDLFNAAADLWYELDQKNMAFNDGGCADDFKRIAYFMEVK